MKNLFNYVMAALLTLAFHFTLSAQTKNPTIAPAANRVEVLDFHTDHRCATCLEIEKLTKKVLNDYYASEMKSGKITFRLINADDKANAAIVKKFFAYGTTLIVYSVKNGKESHVDLTNFAFMNFSKADKFTARLKEEIDAALKNIQP
jgi:hypothetical protein